MFVSDIFRNRTRHKCVYNITAIDNIPSIIENGILCYDAAKKLLHYSIALNAVQERRERVTIPNGLRLHCYANLYFDYNNPMLYKRKDMAEKICVLAVDTSILNNPSCIFSDRNAATDLVKFYPASEGVNQIDFEKVFAQYWNHDDPYEHLNHKAIKCAEILIPQCVSYEYIVGAYVVNNVAEQALLATGFDKRIVINPKVFYR
jgi:hypothetical protein